MVSSRSPSQKLPTSLPACFCLQVANMPGHLIMCSRNHTNPVIKQNPCKRKVAVSEGPSELSPYSVRHPLFLPEESPYWYQRCRSITGHLLQLDRLAWQYSLWPPAIKPWERHSVVEVTTLSWKPGKSLATSASFFFNLRSGVPAQPFVAFLCLTACGISSKYCKVVLICHLKGTNSCMFSVVLCIPFLTCGSVVVVILSICWFVSFTGSLPLSY